MVDNKNYHIIFQYPVMRSSLGDKEFLKSYLGDLEKSAKKFKPFSFIATFLHYLILKNKRRFLFYNTKYIDLISGLENKSCSLCIDGLSSLKIAFRKKFAIYPLFLFYPGLYYLFHNDPLLESRYAKKFVNKVTAYLERLSPEFVVVNNDSLFMQRMLIFCARNIGITSICIQHGVFQGESNFKFLDGQFADYMFVWGKSQEKIYRDNSFKMDKIKIIGYPYNIINKNFKTLHQIKRICIIGQHWENLDVELGMLKKIIFERTAQVLQENNFFLMYKPHPSEKNKKFIPENMELYNYSLQKAFNEFDIFISLTSTALIEATINNKIAIQIYDEKFLSDIFEDAGYCYTIQSKEINNLPGFVNTLKEPFKIPEEAIFIATSISSRFLELSEEL